MRMRKCIERLFLFFLIVLICSCASKPAVVLPPEWGYEKEAIRLHLRSDQELNLYQGTAHTLVFCAYQLRDPNAFNQFLEEKEGLSKLLECGRFDPSVTYSKRWIVYPGKDLTEFLDRFEGTKYLGLIAGYYFLQKENAIRFFKIPVIEEKKGKTITSKVEKLYIDLYLAPQQVQEVKGK